MPQTYTTKTSSSVFECEFRTPASRACFQVSNPHGLFISAHSFGSDSVSLFVPGTWESSFFVSSYSMFKMCSTGRIKK